jgi:hypothetical protein
MNDYEDDELTTEESNKVINTALEVINSGNDNPDFADAIVAKNLQNDKRLVRALLYLLERN